MNFIRNLINPKSSFDASGLLINSTDVHCHILPGVDDGIQTYDDAVEALRLMKQLGVSRMYLTPHVMADFKNNTSTNLHTHFDNFKKQLAANGIEDIPELKLAAEYMLDAAFNDRKKEGLLTFTDNRILVETSYMLPPAGFNSILENLMEEGLSPILAHPERYVYMDERDYDLLKEQGIIFQLNYFSLTGAYGKMAKDKAIRLLKKGYYSFTGSDFHRLARHHDDFYIKALGKSQKQILQDIFDNNSYLW